VSVADQIKIEGKYYITVCHASYSIFSNIVSHYAVLTVSSFRSQEAMEITAMADVPTRTFVRRDFSSTPAGRGGIKKGQFHGSISSSDGTTKDPSTVNLIECRGGGVCGTLSDVANGKLYEFKKDKDGNPVVVETPFDEMPPDGDAPDELLGGDWDEEDTGRERKLLLSPDDDGGGSIRGKRTLQATGTAVIDLMVVWTSGAECKKSDLEPPCDLTAQTRNNILDEIDAAVLYANAAYAASGIRAFLRLVDAHPVYDYDGEEDYEEYWSESPSGGTYSGHSNALREIRSTDDGVLDEVHTRREQAGADVVVFAIDSGEFCGMGYTTTSPETMFSTVHCLGGATL